MAWICSRTSAGTLCITYSMLHTAEERRDMREHPGYCANPACGARIVPRVGFAQAKGFGAMPEYPHIRRCPYHHKKIDEYMPGNIEMSTFDLTKLYESLLHPKSPAKGKKVGSVQDQKPKYIRSVQTLYIVAKNNRNNACIGYCSLQYHFLDNRNLPKNRIGDGQNEPPIYNGQVCLVELELEPEICDDTRRAILCRVLDGGENAPKMTLLFLDKGLYRRFLREKIEYKKTASPEKLCEETILVVLGKWERRASGEYQCVIHTQRQMYVYKV